MISHADCTHPSTPSARAKCRRARAKGEVLEVGFSPPLYSLGPPPKEREWQSEGHKKAQSPRDKALTCDVCGVERIKWRGVDVLTGLTLYVGSRCFYMVKRDPNTPVLIDKRG